MKTKLVRIAIVGRALSGKDIVSEYLVHKHGFVHISSGDMVRDYISKLSLGEPVRELMQRVANEMRVKFGTGVLVDMAMDGNESVHKLVVSGLRAKGEIDRFIDRGGIIVALDSSIEDRYKRSLVRARPGDIISFEQFKEEEQRDSHATDEISQNVNYSLMKAKYTINNDGDIDRLQSKIDNLVGSIKVT